MGLYLCVFKNEEELEGVEVGFYDDFSFFRGTIAEVIEKKLWGSVCPTLMLHSDCDGEWTTNEAHMLVDELNLIKKIFVSKPPIKVHSEWQENAMKLIGLKPSNLNECFIDIDGELLIDRLIGLCEVSIRENEPILFQ